MPVAETGADPLHEEFEQAPFFGAMLTMLNYSFCYMVSHVREFLQSYGITRSKAFKEKANMKVPFGRNFPNQLMDPGFSALVP